MTDDQEEDPIPQQAMLAVICVLAAFAYGGSALMSLPAFAAKEVDSGSRAVVDTCVAEKGPWLCLQTIGAAADEQRLVRKDVFDTRRLERSIFEAFTTIVPAETLLADCGRAPSCASYMAAHGYDRVAVREALYP